MNIKLFPVIAYDASDFKLSGKFFNGTAFLIDDSKIFYTAGHNYYDNSRGHEPKRIDCYALINGELISTEKVFIEYNQDNDKIKKDIAFGKIKDFKSEPFTIPVESNQPIALGYSRNRLDFEILNTVTWKGITFNLYKIPISVGTNSIKSIQNSIIDISFSNVLFFNAASIDLKGLSGGPIINKDELQGILVSNCFIIKDYIDTVKPK